MSFNSIIYQATGLVDVIIDFFKDGVCNFSIEELVVSLESAISDPEARNCFPLALMGSGMYSVLDSAIWLADEYLLNLNLPKLAHRGGQRKKDQRH